MLYMYKQWGSSPLYIRQTSHRTWGWSKDIVPTTWSTDWDYYSAADYVIIILNPSPCCIHKISIVTILHFQHSCPRESYQHLEFSYHIYCHHFLSGSNYDLTLIVDSYEVWFIWQFSLKHGYQITILWCFSVVLVIHQCSHYFFSKIRILFFSGLKWLVMQKWSE